jgi:S-adenosylmethionine:tRNA ribosyltransferase-isomerase
VTPPTAGAEVAGTRAVSFELPAALEAGEPPEVRGTGRDDVRLLVGRRDGSAITHHRFPDIVDVLAPGDLLVINTSATAPAALEALREDGTQLRVHLSTHLPGDRWLVELRAPDGVGSRPFPDGREGEVLALPGGATVRLAEPFSGSAPAGRSSPAGSGHRLWFATLTGTGPVEPYLAAHGAPVRYRHVRRPWPLSAYQTAYAREPGSAELVSAGRAFTPELITALVARGVGVVPIVLHTGVSSPEAHEPPAPERFRVPAATARWVQATRAAGGAVVAVGTTVVRALETVADDEGRVRPGDGWTELVVGPARGVRAVDGLLTGWHEPEASHLRLLEAVAGRRLLERCYEAALAERYLWHEFGDLCLLLP